MQERGGRPGGKRLSRRVLYSARGQERRKRRGRTKEVLGGGPVGRDGRLDVLVVLVLALEVLLLGRERVGPLVGQLGNVGVALLPGDGTKNYVHVLF